MRIVNGDTFTNAYHQIMCGVFIACGVTNILCYHAWDIQRFCQVYNAACPSKGPRSAVVLNAEITLVFL
jgi:hypothetical protein